VAPRHGRNRQRLDLAAPDLSAEVERLVALGATELGDRGGGIELADPDGNEFSLSPG
jgi:Glyoxalase-like domain